MSVHVTEKHLRAAESFVRKVRASGELAPVDLDKFYADDKLAKEKMWDADSPQMPLGLLSMSWECVFAELGIEEDWHRGYHDNEYRRDLNIQYNDKAEKIIGRRVLNESLPDPERQWPEIKALHDIFEAKNVWHNESYWLMQSADNEDELKALLDRVEKRLENLRSFMLPENWEEEKARLTALGCKVPRYRGQRGPVTFAMSVFGPENLIYLCYDEPELATRFSQLILKAILGRARILDEEGGFTPETAPRGWSWCDDNCCLFNTEQYDLFAKPILKGVFDRYCPDEQDSRFQHSDSDMAQHLPTLAELKLNGTNFGPNLTVTEIREHLADAVIRGQLAPFTFSRNEEVNMIAELLRDMEMAREKKGIVFSTAGSINNGSRLSGLRLMMAAVQEFGWGE